MVERFRKGHGNEELKKHLCLYPSTGLQDLIGACMRFETHMEIGSHARKSVHRTEYQSERTHPRRSHARCAQTRIRTDSRTTGDLTTLHPAEIRTEVNNNKVLGSTRVEIVVCANRIPFADRRPCGNSSVGLVGRQVITLQTVNPVDLNLLFAPKPLNMNFLQEIADQVQQYSEGEQNPSEGNE